MATCIESIDNILVAWTFYRSNGSVEIWSAKDNWYQEKVSAPLYVWQICAWQ